MVSSARSLPVLRDASWARALQSARRLRPAGAPSAPPAAAGAGIIQLRHASSTCMQCTLRVGVTGTRLDCEGETNQLVLI